MQLLGGEGEDGDDTMIQGSSLWRDYHCEGCLGKGSRAFRFIEQPGIQHSGYPSKWFQSTSTALKEGKRQR